MTLSVTTAQVRDDLSKDASTYMDDRIARQIQAAKASLLPAIGYKDGVTDIPAENASEFDKLASLYITEYCRANIDGVDNGRMLNSWLIQLGAMMRAEE